MLIRALIAGIARASSSSNTAVLTSSQPFAASSLICATERSTSFAGTFVIDCKTHLFWPPIWTFPTNKARVSVRFIILSPL